MENLRNAYKSREQKDLQNCTFQPDISLSSKSINGSKVSERPIHERAKDIQRQREEILQKMRVEAEMKDENLTFKPKIAKKSEELLMNRSDLLGQSVAERLCKDATERSLKQSYVMSQNKSLPPFNPQLSTYNLSSLREDGLLSKGFSERQELYMQKRREKEKTMQHSSASKCTFKPQINFNSEILVEVDPKRCCETEQERVQRLSQKNPKAEERIKKLKDQERALKYTYHPRINPNSRALALNRSVDSITSADRTKGSRAKQMEMAREREQRECTFQPHINSTSSFSYYTRNEEILEMIKEKEEERVQRMEQKKRDQEYEEMKDCTFQPAITNFAGHPEPTVVKGLGRHLELQEKKKKIEKERRERELKVFELAERYDQRETHDTVPQPFKLSEGRNPCKAGDTKENSLGSEKSTRRTKRSSKNCESKMLREYTMGV
eukprot:TRINITY_DN12311_c0_g1_i2.p1 TRINITY_DN12311_c0_g1~~TRINITY_DN12311_c0_g1_i2.p1  ORF type:complete len:438 (-),score=151.04 TRINITY_DN12311_c0_g1_i2:188-1501(-)